MAKISIDLSSGSLKKEEIIVGIDLGTTNSLVAIINQDKQPVAIKGSDRSAIVPSVIYLDDEDRPLVGSAALPYLVDQPSRTIYSVKRLMGKSYKDVSSHEQYFSYSIIDNNTDELVKVRVGDRFYSPVELSSLILKELKSRAEKHLQKDITKAVITVPAYFNDSQRQATRDAGKLAGLDVLRIINEPTAASLAYGLGLDKSKPLTVAVYDLGGGTFDISILRIDNGIFEVLSTHGNTYLGGDDFDRALVNRWMEKLNLSKDDLGKDKGFAQILRLKAEGVKKSLSDSESVSVPVETPDGRSEMLTVTRDEFEALITPILEETVSSCRKALADAGLKPADIEVAVLVGGSTRIPLVKHKVASVFNKSRIDDSLDPDEVVALGAAVEADILAGNRKDVLLLDVTPLSLGIETLGGLMDTIIPRNSKIPSKAARQYTTSIDGQVNIKINVYQGERDLVAENRKLAEFDLKGIPSMPAGLPKVEVTFLLNADGILVVKAKELRSGMVQEVEVKPTYGLSDQEVETMLKSSLDNAKTDVETRMLVEARTEGEQLIYLTGRFIEKNPGLLKIEEVETTRDLMKKLDETLGSGDRQLIHKAIDELNAFTSPFAQRLMDISISKALKGKSVNEV